MTSRPEQSQSQGMRHGMTHLPLRMASHVESLMTKKRLYGTCEVPVDLQVEDAPEIVRVWILRILFRLGGSRRLLDPDQMGTFDVLSVFGIEGQLDQPLAITSSTVRKLRGLFAGYPPDAASLPLPRQLACNIERIGNLLGLTPVERSLLGLAVLSRTERELASAMEMLGYLPTARIYRALAVLLDVPDKEIREALAPSATLSRTGLLVVDRENTNYLHEKIDVLSDGFAERMTLLDADPAELLRDKVFPSQPPRLDEADFPHVKMLADVARAHLALALQTRRRGTNILIYGVPGVGKTELARVLAANLGVELFEISSEDDDGDPLEGDRRMRAYRAAQWFFSKRRLMFLFDEVEDVFSGGGGYGTRSAAQRRKAWMNRTLELNFIPTIWVSNRADCLDPAFVRRFDVVMELPNPPLSQREKIIRSASGSMALDTSLITRLAANTNLTPAVVARASEVASATATDSESNPGEVLEQLVNSTLRAQGHADIPKQSALDFPTIYDTKFINSEVDLGALAGQLTARSSARLLLHGPPGTGKTAYAKWLARELGVPILVKRASDLLSPYVGEAEKNLADAFAEAQRDGSALLLDEIDSFLQDRRKLRASWEVSMVNEMLTQMESFPGLMFASTNLVASLDQASLRRFDLKVGFRHLRHDQSKEIFRRACEHMGLGHSDPKIERSLRELVDLAPGDYAMILRQHAFKPFKDAYEAYLALAHESSLKQGKNRRIGFI